MKDSILRRARAGAAIVLSSHLLHLLEEVCSHVLILQNGRKIADGTLDAVAARFSFGAPDVSLEEVFIRATSGVTAPPIPSAAFTPPLTPPPAAAEIAASAPLDAPTPVAPSIPDEPSAPSVSPEPR